MVKKKEGAVVKPTVVEPVTVQPAVEPAKKTVFPLLSGEHVAHQLGSFYITNKRLVRYRKSIFGTQFADFQYSRIKGIQEKDTYPLLPLMVTSAIVFFVTIFYNYYTSVWWVLGVCLLITAAGFLLKQRRVYVMFSPWSLMQLPPAKISDSDKFAEELRKVIYK
jgi:hypothetical protein